MPASVPCPTCRKPVPWGPESPFRPFCSERCRLIDLGDWFDERHRIAGSPDGPEAPDAADLLTADGGGWPQPDPHRDPDTRGTPH